MMKLQHQCQQAVAFCHDPAVRQLTPQLISRLQYWPAKSTRISAEEEIGTMAFGVPPGYGFQCL